MGLSLSIENPRPVPPVLRNSLEEALIRFRADLGACRLRPLSIAQCIDDMQAIEAAASGIDADHVLILGTGGASLGAQALLGTGAADPDRPCLHFADNIDPLTWNRTLCGMEPARSHVIAVSKSGETAETLSQALLAMDWLRGAGCRPNRHMTAITEAGPRPLRGLMEAEGVQVLEHPADVGGRFSVLTLAGLLPAVLAGLDSGAVRLGAAGVLDDVAEHAMASSPAVGALAMAAAERDGTAVQVLMPYADRLAALARWWIQLWGESLGKDGKGSTPVAAAGAIDQHSQLQLWHSGTRHHMVTVIAVEEIPKGPVIASGHPELDYLEGHTLGALLAAECQATCESLAAAGVPLRRIAIDRPDERTMGALLAHFMIETILVAHVIGVDPFGQPAVEDGKIRAREKLRAMAP